MLSQRGRYGLRALIQLASVRGGRLVTAAELAGQVGAPVKFLESVLQDLKRQGLLTSTRGIHGGYSLPRRPQDISLGEIVRALDGPLDASPCLLETWPVACPGCADIANCKVHPALVELKAASDAVLARWTLQSAIEAEVFHQPAPARGARP